MKRYRVILSIIGLFSCLAQFAIDIYTPSVPAIALQFHVSLNAVQWSISIYAVGLCLSMLVYGPLSDIIGRRKPLLFGLFLMMVGSLICALSKNIETLIVGRLVQGLGAGAIAVLWRAMMRDLFSGDELAKYSSYLVPVIVGIMAVAPLLGGYFQHYISWRASFVFLLLYAIVSSLLILWQYKEGKLPSNKMNIATVLSSFREVLIHRVFIAYALCVFFAFAAYFSWFLIGPVVAIHLLKLTSIQFGWMNSLALVCMTPLASMLNARWVKRIKGYKMLCFGFVIIFIAGFGLFIESELFGLSVYSVLIAIFLLNFGLGFIWVNAASGAMTPFGHMAGTAATLYAFIQYAGGACVGSLLSELPDHTAIPLAMSWMIIPLLALFVIRVLVVSYHR